MNKPLNFYDWHNSFREEHGLEPSTYEDLNEFKETTQ